MAAIGVSVVMPVRNGGDYLATAVSSILGQSHQTLELLLIDDHSTDRSISTLAKDPRLRIQQNRGNGLVDALNTGVDSASHKFIARMDADDIAHPNRLATQLDYLLHNPNIDVCGCHVELFGEQGIGEGYQIYQAWINGLSDHAEIEREFFIESPIAHPSAMFHRQAILELGGYRDGDFPEDYDLWCRALLAGYTFGKPSGPALLRWRDYPERTSRRDPRYRKQGFINCKAETLSKYLNAKGIFEGVIWGIGPTGLKMHDALEAAGFSIQAFVDINPKKQGVYKRNKPVEIVTGIRPPNSCNTSAKELLRRTQMLIVAVSARGARQQIRDFLNESGWVEGHNYLFVA